MSVKSINKEILLDDLRQQEKAKGMVMMATIVPHSNALSLVAMKI